ncbi:MAG: TRAP transporter large permease, partial [Rhodospirillales bacterium]|nr:TRAP transporter large permease [Rhodospirillales bacterium]
MGYEIILMFVLFLAASAIRMPIGFAMLCSGVLYLFLSGQDPGLLSEQVLNNLFKSFVLLAVPLFIFAANVMNASTISERLFEFAALLVGRLRGGLAHVNVLTSLIFSGMSGSAIADVAGPGKLMIDMMTANKRFDPAFAGAITAASATIGPIIPPSIPMVIYGLVSSTSVGYLFLGGVLPGFFLAIVLMIMVAIIAKRRDFPVEPPSTRKQAVRTVNRSLPALMLPFILLGGIYSGAATPTEAAAIAGAYALLLAFFFYRSMRLAELYDVFLASSHSTVIVAVTIAGAFMFNYVVASEQLPNAIGELMAGIDISPLLFFLLVNVVFLLLGCFLDVLTSLLIIVPMLMPTIRELGIDTVHFGVAIIINMMIGL